MEVWIQLALWTLYAEWLALLLVFLVGCICALMRRSRRIGAAMMLLSGATMTYWFLTPERIALFPNKTVVETSSDVALTIPFALVLHGNQSYIDDGITLAETGLFRVFQAGLDDASIEGEMVLSEGEDCAQRRIDSNVKRTLTPTEKMGGLLFTARTGFSRCAAYVPGSVDPPKDRLDLWLEGPPKERQAIYYPYGPPFSTFRLTITENGNRRVVARREMFARRVVTSLSRLGVVGYDEQLENSEENPYQYIPDVLGFVLTAIHVDADDLPKAGAVSDAELARRASAIVAGISGDIGKLRVAVALAGATRGADGSGAVVARVAPVLLAPFRSLKVRVPSDCWLALRAADGRQSLAPACNAAWEAGGRDSCAFPLDSITFPEQCIGIRRAIWDDAPTGRATVVFGRGSGQPSNVGVSNYGYASKVRVIVRPEDGLLDLVLVAPSTVLWSLEGNVDCLDRVTVVGARSAVVGVERNRIRFRDRYAASRYDSYEAGPLADLLGRAPDRSVSASPDGKALIGERGLRGARCRSGVGSPNVGAAIPAELVTGPLDVTVPLSEVTGCRTFKPGTADEAKKSRCVSGPPQAHWACCENGSGANNWIKLPRTLR